MPLFQEPLRTGYECPHILRNLDLGTREALEGDHLLPTLEPPLDDFPLAAGRDASHVLHLCGRVPLFLHGIQRAESQPYHAPLLVNGAMDPANDDGIWRRRLEDGRAILGILS